MTKTYEKRSAWLVDTKARKQLPALWRVADATNDCTGDWWTDYDEELDIAFSYDGYDTETGAKFEVTV